MISKEQLICDVGDFLEFVDLTDKFLDEFVAEVDREEYENMFNNR